LYAGTSDFQKGYQPRTDIVKYVKGDRIADTHGVVGRWRNHFSQLLNVHGPNDVRQTELYTARPLVLGTGVTGSDWLLKAK